MKKKTIANIVMVFIILAIIISGILGVGHIQGWFDDKSDKNSAVFTEFRGIITLEREGVAYTTTDDTVLRSGDKITCDPGSTVKITVGDGYITLGQSATAEIIQPTVSGFAIELTGGEAFVNAVSSVSLVFNGKQTEVADAVATLSVRTGAQSISVYYGNVEGAQSGEILEWIGEELFVRKCSVHSLNEFNIAQLRKVNEFKTLCFTNGDLDELEAERWAQKEKTDESENSSSFETTVAFTSTEITTESNVENTTEKTASVDKTNPSVNVSTGSTTIKTMPPSETKKPSQSATAPAKTEPTEPEEKLSCTITIRCDTILDNWDNLDPAKATYVPKDGCILPTVTVEFTKGETVFDVLNRVCSTYGIPIEYSWTPMYDSYYIEGINNLYEFDCGSESGWMYKVNGWFPNYGCSSYTLTGGEDIVWCYTCVGLGADVGSGGW